MAGKHGHEIDVPPVVAAEIVVVAKGRIFLAYIPVTRSRHTGLERAVMQHRQIEARSVPGHEHGGEALDAVEETLDQLRLIGRGVAETPQPQPLATAQGARN